MITTLRQMSDEEFEQVVATTSYTPGHCPTCRDEYVYRRDGEEIECDCNEQRALWLHYCAANIPETYWYLGREDFQSEDRDEVLRQLDYYIEKWPFNRRHGMGVTFSGTPLGIGKTFGMALFAKDLIKIGAQVYWTAFAELHEAISDGFTDHNRRAHFYKLERAEVLCIDDVTPPVSQAHQPVLADRYERVVRPRVHHARPTLITTNLEPEQEAEYFPRAFSLLEAHNDWIYFKAEDSWRGGNFRKRLRELRLNGEVTPLV